MAKKAKASDSQPSVSEDAENVAPVEGEGAAPEESTVGPETAEEGTEASSPVTEPDDEQSKVTEDDTDENDSDSSWFDEDDDYEDEDSEDDSLPDPSSDDYNPSQDPSIGSSSLADGVAVEIKSGESPTLNACREAYRAAQK